MAAASSIPLVRVFYTDTFPLPLPDGHRFPAEKYRMLRERVADELPAAQLEVAPAASLQELLQVHDEDYVRAVLDGTLGKSAVRKIGFPWSEGMVERSLRSCGATLAATRAAATEGRAVYLAGGTHHAHRAEGSGFCVFNDVAASARTAQNELGYRHVLIVDTDVHQGDGTATIFESDPSVFTLSIHGASNFPLRKQQSDLDIPLPDDADDRTFLQAVRTGLDEAFARFEPQFVIYLSGADPHEGDKLGRLAVTFESLEARDDMVLSLCEHRDLPTVVCMGGGYGHDIRTSVEASFRTVRRALELPNP